MHPIRQAVFAARAVYSFVGLVRHPEHLQRVFDMADAIAASSTKPLRDMRDYFARDPRGRDALARRPRLGAVDLDELARLPEGTLGRVFADHMRKNALDPAAIPTRDAHDDLAYVRAHLFETHDVWHAVTGFGADLAGEAGLQAFYLAQFPARLAAAILSLGFLNTLLYGWDERDVRMRAIVRGWLLGKRCKPLFGMEWAKLWATPIAEVRRDLGIDIDGVEAALPIAA